MLHLCLNIFILVFAHRSHHSGIYLGCIFYVRVLWHSYIATLGVVLGVGAAGLKCVRIDGACARTFRWSAVWQMTRGCYEMRGGGTLRVDWDLWCLGCNCWWRVRTRRIKMRHGVELSVFLDCADGDGRFQQMEWCLGVCIMDDIREWYAPVVDALSPTRMSLWWDSVRSHASPRPPPPLYVSASDPTRGWSALHGSPQVDQWFFNISRNLFFSTVKQHAYIGSPFPRTPPTEHVG